jgi:hypothetical protein
MLKLRRWGPQLDGRTAKEEKKQVRNIPKIQKLKNFKKP